MCRCNTLGSDWNYFECLLHIVRYYCKYTIFVVVKLFN